MSSTFLRNFQQLTNQYLSASSSNNQQLRAALFQYQKLYDINDYRFIARFPRQESQVLFARPCPIVKEQQEKPPFYQDIKREKAFLDWEIKDSMKRIRTVLGIQESLSCSACPLKETCKNAFQVPDQKAIQTSDVLIVLSAYANYAKKDLKMSEKENPKDETTQSEKQVVDENKSSEEKQSESQAESAGEEQKENEADKAKSEELAASEIEKEEKSIYKFQVWSSALQLSDTMASVMDDLINNNSFETKLFINQWVEEQNRSYKEHQQFVKQNEGQAGTQQKAVKPKKAPEADQEASGEESEDQTLLSKKQEFPSSKRDQQGVETNRNKGGFERNQRFNRGSENRGFDNNRSDTFRGGNRSFDRGDQRPRYNSSERGDDKFGNNNRSFDRDQQFNRRDRDFSDKGGFNKFNRDRDEGGQSGQFGAPREFRQKKFERTNERSFKRPEEGEEPFNRRNKSFDREGGKRSFDRDEIPRENQPRRDFSERPERTGQNAAAPPKPRRFEMSEEMPNIDQQMEQFTRNSENQFKQNADEINRNTKQPDNFQRQNQSNDENGENKAQQFQKGQREKEYKNQEVVDKKKFKEHKESQSAPQQPINNNNNNNENTKKVEKAAPVVQNEDILLRETDENQVGRKVLKKGKFSFTQTQKEE